MTNDSDPRDIIREPTAAADELAHSGIGAALDVHRTLGPGFLETVYEEALCVELALRDLTYERQVPVAVEYKGHRVGESHLDLRVGGLLLVELKAVEALTPVHFAQVISYLKATGTELGLLINFNVRFFSKGVRRVVWTGTSVFPSRSKGI